MLTLQGAVAHCDMPVESGPTLYLPHSQKYEPGYLAWRRPEFRAYFEEHHVQLPLAKGDAVFFNPALFHAAGANHSADIRRAANLLQVSSAFGRAMETVDREAVVGAVYPVLLARKAEGASEQWLENVIAASAEGYPFPTNLDNDPPVDGLAPPSQADVVRRALREGRTPGPCATSCGPPPHAARAEPRHRRTRKDIMGLLDDKVVLVNGGSQGVGAAVARAAVREGAVVAVSGRRPEPGEALVAELAGQGGKAMFVRADLADAEQARESVAQVVQAYGRIDCLVNSAGLTSRGTLLDTTPELFDQHIAINLKAPFFAMQAAVADMVRRAEPGTIVNVITSSAHGGQPFLAPYVAAKAGLMGLTRNAAHAHRWDRIRINGLNIGWTATEGEDATQRTFHGAGDDWRERAAARLPMGKLGRPDEIADFVVLLLSERSGVVTGSVIDWDQNVLGGLD